jgi:hypothetical protein
MDIFVHVPFLILTERPLAGSVPKAAFLSRQLPNPFACNALRRHKASLKLMSKFC